MWIIEDLLASQEGLCFQERRTKRLTLREFVVSVWISP